VNTVSKFQDTRGLDTVYLGQPFYGHTDGYSISNIRSGIDYHPDVDAWLDRVIANGGNASPSTIAALTNFCTSIDNAGLRNKFYRLNLFCGNNLAAALVPLYTGPNRYDKPQYGSSKDINYNFIESNYNETGSLAGLTSSGADPTQANVGTQYLDTNLKISEIVPIGQLVNSVHIAGTASVMILSSGTQYIIFNTTTFIDIYALGFGLIGSNANMRGTTSGSTLNSLITPIAGTGLISPAQHFIASRIGANDHRNYQNGTQSGSTSNQASNINTSSFPIYLFRQSGGLAIYSNLRLSNYSIGLGLSSSEALAYYNILQTFQTALNRNV
jgi:hypothetical protein